MSCQSADGSWKDISLFQKIFGSDITQTIANEKNKIAVITYLIAKWIEKNYPEKEYSLVAKKGLNFAKK